ncbi:PLP-dependent cysteine synthase family protein [Halalkalicoccus jeotgali]|uniref:Cystathionine beta-synthase n=1 Tax=Halalkalicoccus jeotgali (strain DSM 18796 / CECT 7217 / JCM 14584 / KCTC 4019 / B3) TaxID=795797 RepID=D8J781_HALJB|nr:cysteine synthase family protein [Halalkalicoccus jeotgali]ADJ13976.1 Cystathionine beta-synthase [Halalkalicoccus jeotgali B3]ELY33979.1 Cystathionine beta-synthase [Halalkalicoccus jeotgali B3]
MEQPVAGSTDRSRIRDAPTIAPYPECEDPILGRTGGTPIVEYGGDGPGRIYCKLEYENPTGSMKDRVALGMISSMRANGDIDGEGPVVEASSGNTGGAVALVCARLGLECEITFPEGTSGQKSGYMEAYGASTRPCPDVASGHEDYYHREAKRIAEKTGGTFLNQYENELNPQVHYEWTGEEVLEQLGGEVTHIVSPMGTGGTVSGIARRVKEEYPEVRVIGVDGEKSNIWTAFHGEEPVEYDVAVEGLGKSERLPTMWFEYIDDVRAVADEAAFERARAEARDGLLIGPSSAAALEVADEYSTDPEAVVLTMVCDNGDQYFDVLNGS